MPPRSLGSLLVFLPLTLAAQSLQERAIPIHDWAAPRQVRRSQLQAQRPAPKPKLQLPGGVTSDILVFVPITPCRLADTLPGSGYPALGSTPLAALTPVTLPIAGSCGVPALAAGSGPQAYSLNVTVVPPNGTIGGYLLVYPNPVTPIPLVASMTWNPAASYQSNAVITAASSDGSVNVVANAATDVVVDINGYYAAPTDSGDDTALGAGALASDTLGSDNTAFGYQALEANVNGNNNTAVGYQAMQNTIGPSNLATGSNNTAFGSMALAASSDGYNSTAIGALALENGNGYENTAVGFKALQSTTGSNNIALGQLAGFNVGSGSGNIMIGSEGMPSDSNTIRIGDCCVSYTGAYINGISGIGVSGGTAVVVNSNGQLGVESSSRRYKEDVQDMGDASKGLLQLRPVTFHYKKADFDGSKPLEYGLIAEEVADVYPELVVRGKDGEVESIQYQKLPAMLLNEMQKQNATIQKLEARLAALEAQLANTTAKTTSEKTPPSSAGGR
jgi:hypothetical protein